METIMNMIISHPIITMGTTAVVTTGFIVYMMIGIEKTIIKNLKEEI